MVIGINYEHDLIDKTEQFATIKDGKLKQVLVLKTIQQIKLKYGKKISVIVFPASIDGFDYNFEDIVAHIRTIKEPQELSKIAIIVITENEDDLEKEDYYKNIGATITAEFKQRHFARDIRRLEHEFYLKSIGQKPYSGGRHDKANEWGALISMFCLAKSSDDKQQQQQAQQIMDRLNEQIYFKLLSQKLTSKIDDKQRIILTKEQSDLKRYIKNSKILIIEDQLKDGWQDVYTAIFNQNQNIKLLFADDTEQAKQHIKDNSNIDLILLDVRLGKDREQQSQNEIDNNIDKLSGVVLSKWIREYNSTVPIIAATASNKSWTLEKLLEQGINSYWVKDTPEITSTTELGMTNLIELYKKINSTLAWSQRTKAWIDNIYKIADDVFKTDIKNGKRIKDKAQSVHALLFRNFTPFAKELSANLQMNLVFLELYSCVNDLVVWLCEITDDNKWYLTINGERNIFIDRDKHEKNKLVLVSKTQKISNFDDFWYPQKNMAIEIMLRFDENKTVELFKKLAKKRNMLPQIHGTTKTGEKICIQDKDNDDIIKVLLSLLRLNDKKCNKSN
ncbi:MAG: hypothetical protein DRQ51_03005 [Gammaproteobacteria bacterium]|nr:MAG: hypothetical protein DRQ51_03005 [Gammaproteobacteria bacterium]